MKLESIDSYQRTYFLCFVVATVICFSPLKGLAYVAPYVCLLVMITMSGAVEQMVTRTVIGGAIALGCFILYYALYADFVPGRFFLSLITYSAIIPLLFFEPRRLNNPELLDRMLAFTKIVLVVEGSVGIIQALYGMTQTGGFDADNGDYVEGTIDLALESSRSFSNPMYAVNMTLLGIGFFLHGAKARKSLAMFLVVLASIVLASVVHVLIFLVLALVATLLVRRVVAGAARREMTKQPRRGIKRLAMLAVVYAFATLIAGNLSKIGEIIELQFGLTLPKAVITADAVLTMPRERPLMLLLGLGPGQFCSRAGVIATGEYIKDAAVFETEDPYMFAKYLRPLLDLVLLDGGTAGGSSVWPWYSWLTVYTELGVISCLLILLAFGAVIVSVAGSLRQPLSLPQYALPVMAGTLLIAFLGVQENYWEIPQAILPGILLLQVMYARAKYGTQSVP